MVPQTISLALSIRELIRQGYLFGAKVLVRPLTERAVTMVYLFKKPDAQQIWGEGWKHGKRPNLQQMVEYLNSTLSEGALQSMKGFTHALNSATHGDPLSAQWNVVLREDGVPVFLPSKKPTITRSRRRNLCGDDTLAGGDNGNDERGLRQRGQRRRSV